MRNMTEALARQTLAHSDFESLPEFPPNYPPVASWAPLADDSRLLKVWRRSLSRHRDRAPVLYVHIPFCRTVCTFCGFYRKKLGSRGETGRFLASLRREMSFFKDVFRGVALRSLCLGGGTPTILDERELEELFGALRDHFTIDERTQVACEASPSTLTLEKLRLLKRLGVAWVSIGLQSLESGLLDALNRPQDGRQALQAVRWAKEAGIEQVQADLMVGLPGQTEESFLRDVRAVAELDIERIYLFDLQSLRRVPLAAGGVKPEAGLALEDVRAARRKAIDVLIAAGYRMRCGHWVYKRRGEAWPYSYDQGEMGSYSILGLGPSSVSYAMDGVRHRNISSESSYEAALDQGRLPIESGRFLTPKDEMVNSVLLDALHRGEIDSRMFRRRYGMRLEEAFPGRFARLRAKGVLARGGSGYVVLSRETAARELRLEFYAPQLMVALARRLGLAENSGKAVAAPKLRPPTPELRRDGGWYECRIAEACNASCRFCWCDLFQSEGAFPTLEEIGRLLLQARNAGRRRVAFTGGEPTLNPRLEQAVALAKKLGFERVGLHTNALLLEDAGLVARLRSAGLDEALVAVHAASATLHDRLMSVPGAFERVERAAAHLSAEGIETGIVFVLNRLNLPEAASCLKRFRKLGATRFVFSFMRSTGRLRADTALRRELDLTWGEALPFIREVVQAGRRLSAQVEILHVPPCVLGEDWELAGDMTAENAAVPGDARESSLAHSARPKLRRCLECRYLLRCPGPCEDYLELHGSKGVRPIV